MVFAMTDQVQFLKNYGPWALVAGASEGLGEAFAEELAARGFSLALVARREDKLNTMARRLEQAYGTSVRCLVADLALPETALAISARCSDINIGLLIYNAAFAPVGDFTTTALDRVRQVVAVNVRGSVDLLHTFLPRFRARDRAGIVLMSSLAGDHGSPYIATYAASKAFITALAQGLWHELRPDGVDVTACIAGAVRTPGFAQVMHSGNSREAPGTLDAAVVARAALQALGRTPVVVPGSVNRLARFLMRRVLPAKVAIRIMASSTSGLGVAPTAQENTAKERTHG